MRSPYASTVRVTVLVAPRFPSATTTIWFRMSGRAITTSKRPRLRAMRRFSPLTPTYTARPSVLPVRRIESPSASCTPGLR